MQRALIQYRNPKNHDLVVEALKKAGREDLIGYDKKCLVRPGKAAKGPKRKATGQARKGAARNGARRSGAPARKPRRT